MCACYYKAALTCSYQSHWCVGVFLHNRPCYSHDLFNKTQFNSGKWQLAVVLLIASYLLSSLLSSPQFLCECTFVQFSERNACDIITDVVCNRNMSLGKTVIFTADLASM